MLSKTINPQPTFGFLSLFFFAVKIQWEDISIMAASHLSCCNFCNSNLFYYILVVCHGGRMIGYYITELSVFALLWWSTRQCYLIPPHVTQIKTAHSKGISHAKIRRCTATINNSTESISAFLKHRSGKWSMILMVAWQCAKQKSHCCNQITNHKWMF